MSDNGLNKNSSTIVYENNTKNIYKEFIKYDANEWNHMYTRK